ncbi:hypothetical protein [Leptospira vanthielii]|uniref:Uncharacterized protein n=1 Tax=Leptospira vanthielii TaxID=293085 RepID=A0ABY2NJJ3_9LEPT|nr:hypothetical protein [Leptospira vanthielii]TGM45995.1 hypothetical protein EHQ95_17575 [Leptospira vanthielii]
MATNAAGDVKYYGFVNGCLAEKLSETGHRTFYPAVPLDNPRISSILLELSKKFAYWESSDYEVELKKSGYYQLKESLDQDYENKTGYWTSKVEAMK